jgi:hypothetical protein
MDISLGTIILVILFSVVIRWGVKAKRNENSKL